MERYKFSMAKEIALSCPFLAVFKFALHAERLIIIHTLDIVGT